MVFSYDSKWGEGEFKAIGLLIAKSLKKQSARGKKNIVFGDGMVKYAQYQSTCFYFSPSPHFLSSSKIKSKFPTPHVLCAPPFLRGSAVKNKPSEARTTTPELLEDQEFAAAVFGEYVG
jgi:hypothetical protein